MFDNSAEGAPSLWGYADQAVATVASERLARARVQPVLALLSHLPAVKNTPQSARNPRLGETTLAQPFATPRRTPELQLPSQLPSPTRSDLSSDLRLDVIGAPSLNIIQDARTGDLLIEWERQTQYMASMHAEDWDGMRLVGQRILNRILDMSNGPYQTRDLRQMNHPYGFDALPAVGGKGGQPVKRAVPRFFEGKSIGSVKGVRGSVPTMAVVNRQSGTMNDSWQMEFVTRGDKLVLQLRNTAKSRSGFSYPFALASGTRKMQAHGPFATAPLMFASQLNAAWAQAVRRARTRAQQSALSEAQVTGNVPPVPLAGTPLMGAWDVSLWNMRGDA